MILLNNNQIMVLQDNVKVGDIVKALNLQAIGKDGKPTSCTIKVVSDTTCEIVIVPTESNTETYDLYAIADLKPTDLLDKGVILQFNTLGFALYFQSSGERDMITHQVIKKNTQKAWRMCKVTLYEKHNLKDHRVQPSFSGYDKEFVAYCKDNGKLKVLDFYESEIKTAKENIK